MVLVLWQPLKPHALEKVTDQGKRSQPLGLEREFVGPRRGLRGGHSGVSISARYTPLSRPMPQRSRKQLARVARLRIERIRGELASIDYLCSGTLLERTKVCGKPNCRCATDPAARHGPYYDWGHMRAGRGLIGSRA